MQKYTCPCCGYKTIEREDTFYDLCPVCFWETDPIQLANPHYKGGANQPSLAEAQQHFILFGACEKDDLFKTRMPLADEIKDINFQTFYENTEGVLYFKRHWNESTGSEETDTWGTSDYYFETDKNSDVLKQIVVFKNGKILKYSTLHLEDEYGGLTDQALDLNDSGEDMGDNGYGKISKNEFFTLWNKPKIDSFSKNKIHLLGWHLAIFIEKIIYPNPVFKKEETLISATLDHRFMLDLSYETHAKFVLKIKEGNTWVHFFNYMNWDETVAVTQRWINEIQEANKTVDVKKVEEEKYYNVRVSIDNQLVMSKLTTWRNMDWGVEKFRNIEIQVRDETFSIIDTFTDFENMLLALQKSLPKNYKIEICFFCRFSCYHPVGNNNFGALDCFRSCKSEFVKTNDKNTLFDLYEKEKEHIFMVEETHYCEEFQWIKSNDWAFKNQIKD
jgi:Cysteine-rich CPCC